MVSAIIGWLTCPLSAIAQLPPSIGYMYPPSGQAGQTIEVTLGGYDWTSDMQVFVRDERIRLEIVGEPSPVIVPEPPYWFGKKARRTPYKLPRETKAKLTIPADVEPGVVRWQAANANGATACGRFVVSDLPILLEAADAVNVIDSLPVRVCGQIKLVREVDRFRFAAAEEGLVKCSMVTSSIASPLRAILEVRDADGKLVAEAADTAGSDVTLYFKAHSGESYTAAIFDLDFCGDRSFVYQLSIAPVNQIEEQSTTVQSEIVSALTVPAVVAGVFEKNNSENRYRVSGQAGEIWTITASGEKTGSPVDPAVTVFDASGKQLARGDDRAGSTDAEIEFSLPAAGEFDIVVSDLSGSCGSPAATYEMSIQRTLPDFQLQTVEMLSAPIGGNATLELTVTRRGGFTEPIGVKLVGLPDGVSVADNLQVPVKQNSLKVNLQVDTKAAATAAMVSVQGQALINQQETLRTSQPVLLCTTIKPPFEIDAEGQDDVTKWPRGTTFPAPVLITRNSTFTGEILLEMTSQQGRHRQGITGPDLRVGPDVSRELYPVFLPEWLETTRTSRMVVNGVAQVADPRGNLRYSVSRQKTRMGFLPTGALLKISTDQPEIVVEPEVPLVIPVIVHRDASLSEPLTLTLVSEEPELSPFSAKPQSYAADVSRHEFAIDVNASLMKKTEYSIKIRGTLMRDGQYPVVSETTAILELPAVDSR